MPGSINHPRWVYYNSLKGIYYISRRKPVNNKTPCTIVKVESSAEAQSFIDNFGVNFIKYDNLNDFIKVCKSDNDICGYNFDIHLNAKEKEFKKNFDISSDECVAYVDGSFSDSNQVCGSGVVFMTCDYVERMYSATKKKENLISKNIAAEIIAVVIAICRAKEINARKITIYYDCEAVKKLALKELQPRTPMNMAYVKFIDRCLTDIVIDFQKIKSHTGDWGNSDADALARTATNCYN